MWIFTTCGFFSVVCARKDDGAHGQPIDPDRMMIRARHRNHLQSLKRRFPALLVESEILESAGTDYPFRIIIAKPKWIRVLAALGEEMDYDNFKSKVSHSQGDNGHDYEDALHEVWSVMRQFQE